MAWQSSTINPATTNPAADISKITNDLQQLRGVIGGTPDVAIPSVWTTPTNVLAQTANSATTAGTSTAYTLAPAQAITSYAAGQTFWVTFHAASGANPTLQVSGVASPPTLVRQAADGTYVNIAANDIPINHRSRVTLLSASQALIEDLPPVVASIAGFKNKIINGAMAIDQRNNGALVSITTGSALAYTVDRWFVWVTGTGNIAGVQRVSGTSPNEFLLQIGNGGSGRTVRVAQRIEASDSQDLAGMVATLSADLARTPTGGTVVTWTASYANTRDSFGTVAAPTKTQIATGTFTVSSTVTRYSTQISIPSAAITGIEIEFSWQTGTVVSDSVIGRVQLEPGSVATPFEHRPFGAEFALCQRYYQTFRATSFFYAAGSNTIYSPIIWPLMRATPTAATPTQGLYSNTAFVSLTPENGSGGRINIGISAAGYGGGASTFTLSAEL